MILHFVLASVSQRYVHCPVNVAVRLRRNIVSNEPIRFEEIVIFIIINNYSLKSR